VRSTDKDVAPSEHFDKSISELAIDQVSAHGPAGLSGAQVALLALILGGLLGVAGLISLCLMVWFSHQRFGVDRSAKHGISVKDTSRMGGVAIALFLAIVWLGTVVYPTLSGEAKSDITWGPSFLLPVVLLACVGFLDDLGVSLTPVTRLLITTLILTVGFVLVPAWMPNHLGELIGGTSLGFGVGLVIVSVFTCVGFINAGNMADGANGLFSGICLAFFVCVWFLTADNFYFSMSLGLLSFFLINVLTGRIIMGDFGAYGLSALIALVGFDLFDQGLVGLGFLATLLSYPCVEIIRIFVVRIGKGESPFRADNQHSHNLLNEYFSNIVESKTLANSLTGISIAMFSVTPAVVILFEEGQRNEMLCGLVFGLQCLVFVSVHAATNAFKPKHQAAIIS
jgi:UDP-N-acetylmuramyl pentapeptide phosphotransferase/UDP-N-acetylglucosamine-1-phosphate transferase